MLWRFCFIVAESGGHCKPGKNSRPPVWHICALCGFPFGGNCRTMDGKRDCRKTRKSSTIGKEDRYERNPSGVSFVCNHRFFRTFQVLKNRTQLVKKVFFDKLKAPSSQMVLSGAGDEARTRYLDLGKVALYQMSYARKRKIDYTRESRICQPLRSTFFNFFSKEFQ